MQINQYQSLLTKCDYIEAVSDSLIKNIENQEKLQLFSKYNQKLKECHQLKALEQQETQLNAKIMSHQQLQLKQKISKQSYQSQIQQAYLVIKRIKQQNKQVGKIKHQKIISNRALIKLAKELKEFQKQLLNERKLLNLQIKNDNCLRQNNLQVMESISKAELLQNQLRLTQQTIIQAQKQHLRFKSLQEKYEKLAQKKQLLLFQSAKNVDKISNECQNKVNQIGDILSYDQEMNNYVNKLLTKIKEQEVVIQQIQKRQLQKLSQFVPSQQFIEQQFSSQDDDYFKHQVQNLRKTIANRKFNQRVKLLNQQKLISFKKDSHQKNKYKLPSQYSQHKAKIFKQEAYNQYQNRPKHDDFEGPNQLQRFHLSRAKAEKQYSKRKRNQSRNDSQIFKISVEPISHSKNIYAKHQKNTNKVPSFKGDDNILRNKDSQRAYYLKMQENQLQNKKRQFLSSKTQNIKNINQKIALDKEQLNYVTELLQKKQEELMKLSKIGEKNYLRPHKYSRLETEYQKQQPFRSEKVKKRFVTQPLSIKYSPFKKDNKTSQKTSSDLFGKTRSDIMNKLKSRIRIRTRQTEQQKEKQANFIKKNSQHQKSRQSAYINSKNPIQDQNNRTNINNHTEISDKYNQSIQKPAKDQYSMPNMINSRHSVSLNRKIKDVYVQKLNSRLTSPNSSTSNMKMIKYKSKVDQINSQDDKVESLLEQLKKLKQSAADSQKSESNLPTRVNSQRSTINDQKIQVFKFSKNRKSRIKSASHQKGKVQQRESQSEQSSGQQLQKIEQVDESFKNTINYT